MSYKIKINCFFEAAHMLPDSEYLLTTACQNLHGHTYKVTVIIPSDYLQSGMVVDFKAVKNIINRLDHKYLGYKTLTENYYPFDIFSEEFPPTAENIAKWIFDHIKNELGFLARVDIIEGYKGEENSCNASYIPEEE